jgi:hypothetical protein
MKKRRFAGPKATLKSYKTIYRLMPHALIILMLLLSNFLFSSSTLITFALFMVLVPIFAFFDFSDRLPIYYSIVMFVLAAIVLPLSKTNGLANQWSIYAYWLIVAGVLCMTINYFRER